MGASPSLNQYVTIPLSPELEFNFGGAFSVSWWVNYTSPCGDVPMIASAISSTYKVGWSFADSLEDDKVGGGLEISFESGSGDYTASAAYPIDDGDWHHITVTADLVNLVAVAYIDGVAMTQYHVNGGSSIVPQASLPANGTVYSTYPITIGNDPTGFYSGYESPGGYTIDDLGIWNRVLSSNEVASIYSSGTNGVPIGSSSGGITLSIQPHGAGQLQISWSSGTLQSAPALSGPWTPVSGATAPSYVVTPAPTGSQFYRVH